jgi:hypothetical protein
MAQISISSESKYIPVYRDFLACGVIRKMANSIQYGINAAYIFYKMYIVFIQVTTQSGGFSLMLLHKMNSTVLESNTDR